MAHEGFWGATQSEPLPVMKFAIIAIISSIIATVMSGVETVHIEGTDLESTDLLVKWVSPQIELMLLRTKRAVIDGRELWRWYNIDSTGPAPDPVLVESGTGLIGAIRQCVLDLGLQKRVSLSECEVRIISTDSVVTLTFADLLRLAPDQKLEALQLVQIFPHRESLPVLRSRTGARIRREHLP